MANLVMSNCRNLNHGRMNVPVRHCPDCGMLINSGKSHQRCGDTEHAAARKQRLKFCMECGKKL